MDGLIRDSVSPDPARRDRARLWMQPGSYACSTPKIDRIVDLAGAQQGVVGAQLSGAGLGGLRHDPGPNRGGGANAETFDPGLA